MDSWFELIIFLGGMKYGGPKVFLASLTFSDASAMIIMNDSKITCMYKHRSNNLKLNLAVNENTVLIWNFFSHLIVIELYLPNTVIEKLTDINS